MPSSRLIFTAVAVGALGGALSALWITIAESQGQRPPWLPPVDALGRAAEAATAATAAHRSAPHPTQASKPVVDGAPGR